MIDDGAGTTVWTEYPADDLRLVLVETDVPLETIHGHTIEPDTPCPVATIVRRDAAAGVKCHVPMHASNIEWSLAAVSFLCQGVDGSPDGPANPHQMVSAVMTIVHTATHWRKRNDPEAKGSR